MPTQNPIVNPIFILSMQLGPCCEYEPGTAGISISMWFDNLLRLLDTRDLKKNEFARSNESTNFQFGWLFVSNPIQSLIAGKLYFQFDELHNPGDIDDERCTQ